MSMHARMLTLENGNERIGLFEHREPIPLGLSRIEFVN